MQERTDFFTRLAQQIRCGDRAAVGRFRSAFEPQLVRIVRRVLDAGCRATELEQRILAEAHDVFWESLSEPTAREAIIHQVALRLCRNIVERLQARPERRLQASITEEEACCTADTMR